MPYKAKGKCVYKKKRDGSLGEKVGCTDGPVKDYLAALYANTDESLEASVSNIWFETPISRIDELFTFPPKPFLPKSKETISFPQDLESAKKL